MKNVPIYIVYYYYEGFLTGLCTKIKINFDYYIYRLLLKYVYKTVLN